jgi:hypothetical protein
MTIATMALLLVLVGIAVGAGGARAQTGAGFDLTWHVMGGAGGDGPLTGSGFSLDATLSQTAIGPANGGSVSVWQGYWYGLGPTVFGIYLPIVTKAYTH